MSDPTDFDTTTTAHQGTMFERGFTMLRKDVIIGQRYLAKVSGAVRDIQILHDRGTYSNHSGREIHAGFDAVNLLTGRRIIVTAGRLRRVTPPAIRVTNPKGLNVAALQRAEAQTATASTRIDTEDQDPERFDGMS